MSHAALNGTVNEDYVAASGSTFDGCAFRTRSAYHHATATIEAPLHIYTVRCDKTTIENTPLAQTLTTPIRISCNLGVASILKVYPIMTLQQVPAA